MQNISTSTLKWIIGGLCSLIVIGYGLLRESDLSKISTGTNVLASEIAKNKQINDRQDSSLSQIERWIIMHGNDSKHYWIAVDYNQRVIMDEMGIPRSRRMVVDTSLLGR